MCQAQFAPASPAPSGTAASSAVSAGTTGAPSASAEPAAAGNDTAPQGGSKTHTIIVAPTQGVLRFGTSPFLSFEESREADGQCHSQLKLNKGIPLSISGVVDL